MSSFIYFHYIVKLYLLSYLTVLLIENFISIYINSLSIIILLTGSRMENVH